MLAGRRAGREPEVVPLCWMHPCAFDTGRLELLPYLEPRWRAEVAHAGFTSG
jgi:hypothetical protein